VPFPARLSRFVPYLDRKIQTAVDGSKFLGGGIKLVTGLVLPIHSSSKIGGIRNRSKNSGSKHPAFGFCPFRLHSFQAKIDGSIVFHPESLLCVVFTHRGKQGYFQGILRLFDRMKQGRRKTVLLVALSLLFAIDKIRRKRYIPIALNRLSICQ
jgi:hypothetical protein